MNVHAPILRSLSQVLDEMPAGEKWEIIDGGLYCQAAASFGHNVARDGLLSLLKLGPRRDFTGPAGWWIVSEQRFIGPDPDHLTLEPNLAGWRKERMPHPPEVYPDIAPDWACEVLSPESHTRDRGAKMDAYARLGVRWYWLVDPTLRTLEAFELRGGAWVSIAALRADASAAVAPFEGITLDLAVLWVD